MEDIRERKGFLETIRNIWEIEGTVKGENKGNVVYKTMGRRVKKECTGGE